ncbi:MAG: MtnX-like HAD-IB family phosphatase [Miltoncostaeaceae bacterium]
MARLFIAVDFDGTITRRDTLHVIVEAFGTRGLWAELEPLLRSGEITIEEAMEREFADVRATPEEVLELVLSEAPIRPGFAELVAWSRSEGHGIAVLSNGFRRVIDAVLGAAGLADLPIASHDADFRTRGCRLIWSERGVPCDRCGRRCKRHDLHEMWDEEDLVYVGDGISDRCAARLARTVFAREGLAEHLREEGVSFMEFEDFFDVLDHLRGPVATAA